MPYIDDRKDVEVRCDKCHCMVNIQDVEFIYIEEIDDTYIECNNCLREEGSI